MNNIGKLAAKVLDTLKDAKEGSMIEYHSKTYDDTWSVCTAADLRHLCQCLIELVPPGRKKGR